MGPELDELLSLPAFLTWDLIDVAPSRSIVSVYVRSLRESAVTAQFPMISPPRPWSAARILEQRRMQATVRSRARRFIICSFPSDRNQIDYDGEARKSTGKQEAMHKKF